jgi:5-methylcytosine-specific restriction enzyme A
MPGVVASLAEYRTKEQKKKFYNSSAWQKLRHKALKRDNNECQECKRLGKVHTDSVKEDDERKSVELNVHHKKEIEFYPHEALNLDNLETLCLDHHNQIHNKNFTPKKPKWNDERW